MCSYTKIHEWQTRLALIKPSEDPSAYLELSLVVVDLVDLNTGAIINHDTLVTYDALSYAWGTASASAKCICDGNTISLRDNLDSALRYLRKPQHERYVWIDFLCINQDDLVEKAVQIPRMKNIYSKASTVVAWLGESLTVATMIRRCNEECGPNVEPLTCSNHQRELWPSIFDFSWFRRTWVRQEVFAAEKLKVCSPYFSTTWELFIAALHSRYYYNFGPPGPIALENMKSLNELYSSRRLKLLDLLQQGSGFEASVPHDHIFSVLGMISTPKHDTRGTIPVTYDKTYHEVCGDATRYVIRESRSISILQLCTWQKDRSYAFHWPTIGWTSPWGHDFELLPGKRNRGCDDWFDIENPIREVNDLRPSKNTGSSLISDQSVSNRPLVLYGEVWGTLTGQLDDIKLDHMHGRPLPTYGIDHGTETDFTTNSSSKRYIDNHHQFVIRKISRFGSISPKLKGRSVEKSDVWWRCFGSAKEGDMFVSLEPDSQNVLLRKCSRSCGMFEVVGWHVPTKSRLDRNKCLRGRRPVDGYEYGPGGYAEDMLGPWEQFKIR